MPTTPAPDATVDSARRSRQLPRALAVVAVAVATFAVWTIAVPLAGVDLAVQLGPVAPQQVGPITIVVASLLTGLAAWALLAMLERFSSRPRTAWMTVAVVGLVLSLGAPLTGGVTVAAKLVLVCMHLVAAAILLPVLARTTARRT